MGAGGPHEAKCTHIHPSPHHHHRLPCARQQASENRRQQHSQQSRTPPPWHITWTPLCTNRRITCMTCSLLAHQQTCTARPDDAFGPWPRPPHRPNITPKITRHTSHTWPKTDAVWQVHLMAPNMIKVQHCCDTAGALVYNSSSWSQQQRGMEAVPCTLSMQQPAADECMQKSMQKRRQVS